MTVDLNGGLFLWLTALLLIEAWRYAVRRDSENAGGEQ